MSESRSTIKVSTPDLCDEHGDAVRVAEHVFKHYGGLKQFAGEIATVKCFEDNSKVAEMLRAEGNDRVLVVDGGGSSRRSLLGDMLVTLAQKNNWRGVVLYGYLRDVEEIAPMPVGIVALGSVPRKTQKCDLGDVNVPLHIAGLTIKPGEFIYVDETGVVVADKWLL